MMKHRQGFLSGGLVWAGVIFAAGLVLRAEECKLELVRLEPLKPGATSPAQSRVYRSVSPQYFRAYFGENAPRIMEENDFENVVQKEPEKYVAEYPFRGVAKLGSKKYGFVLDKKAEQSKTYDRLYFDLNGNGDLTDDQPIDAETPGPPIINKLKNGQFVVNYDGITRIIKLPDENKDSGVKEKAEEQIEKKELTEKEKQEVLKRVSPVIGISSRFPCVDLTLDLDGKQLDYSFFLNASLRPMGSFQYATASFTPAVYRRGEITLDGKTVPVAVLDYNSNGRFDDVMSIREDLHGPEGQLYTQSGDVLLIDPEKTSPIEMLGRRGSNAQRLQLAKLHRIEGKLYEIRVSPTGDTLSFMPSDRPLGKITSPQAPCQVQIIGDQGYLSLALEKSQPAEIPAGQWRVISYTLRVENWQPPESKSNEETPSEEEKKIDQTKTALTSVLKKRLLVSSPPTLARPINRSTMIMARGTSNGEAVNVQADQTATLKFGPPYQLLVRHNSQPGVVLLSLVLQGADHEVVSGLSVNGQRPPQPELTITDPQGVVVLRDNFKYG
jgi:hypothetical protein